MDMQRTYLGHDFFHEPVARDVLYKISKAYSIYDEEVGYCQGLSFIIAVLLLQVRVGRERRKREVSFDDFQFESSYPRNCYELMCGLFLDRKCRRNRHLQC